jgi:hypothetical protein
MKILQSKLVLVLAAVIASLAVAEGTFSATHTTARVMASNLETFAGSIFTAIRSAGEPVGLLIVGAFLTLVAIRIRQFVTDKSNA